MASKKIIFFLIFYICSAFANNPFESLTTVMGEHENDLFILIEGIGDMNGDGFDDFAVGATKGRYVKIYFGGTSIDTSNYIKIENCDVESISSGDFNGDGFKDLIIGEPDAVNYYKGRVRLYMGSENISSDPQLIFSRTNMEYLGNNVSFIGDINNDGFEDIAISAERRNEDFRGRVYIHFGNTLTDTIPEIILDGKDHFDMFGAYVSPAGNVNGDEFDDFLVGAPSEDAYVYLFFGGDTINFENAIEIKDTTQNHNEGCGEMVGNLGDINGDHFDDFVITWCKKLSIYYGAYSFFPNVNLNFYYNNNYKCISELGDLNNDDFDDYAVATNELNIFLGESINDTIPSFSENLFPIRYIDNFGDINQDGKPDIGISRTTGNSSGELSIYSYSNNNNILNLIHQKLKKNFILKSSYPNPFNSSINIQYQINSSLNISVIIYNNQGKYIKSIFTGFQQPGYYVHQWDGKDELQRDITSGIYIIKITISDFSNNSEIISRKVILVK